MMWILRASDAERDSMIFRVPHGAIRTIGRAPRADFILDRALVSRLHCRLEGKRDHIEVLDLASTNGTFVNGKRVERAMLGDGDKLRVGRIELQVEHAVG